MKLKRRTEDGFNLSFLDVMACGLGAVILIFILVDFNAFSDTAAPEQKKLESELAAAQRDQQQLQKSIDEINENIAMEAGKQDESQQNQNETTQQQDKLLQDISSQLAVVADLENQLAAVASIPTPDANIAMSGTRKEELLIESEDLNRVWVLRKVLNPLSSVEAMELLLDKMGKTKSNADFLAQMQKMS